MHLSGDVDYYADGMIRIYFAVNDVIYTTAKYISTKYSTQNGWQNFNMSTVLYLHEGDYIMPYIEIAGGQNIDSNPENTSFDGFFIGE